VVFKKGGFMKKYNLVIASIILVSVMQITVGYGADQKSITENVEIPQGYNTPIPSDIMTPDKVETKLGTLEFFDGLPTEETVRKVYDNLDYIRGVETFLNGIPACSIEVLYRGMQGLGAKNYNQVVIMDKLMDSNPLFLTGNTDTVYVSSFFNLKETGPIVIEMPADAGPGTVNDAFFRFVVDMGPPGPDRGKGGKYLIFPHDYKGEIPEGYFVAKSTSYINWLILRGFLVDGKPDVATKMFKEGLKIYPLKNAENSPKMEFISGSGISFNTIHANTYEFYEELNTVIQREPISMLDPELRGLFASIGIEKSKPFQPDERMKKILTAAVAVGNATARALVFNTRDKEAYYYKGSQWKRAFVGGDYQWLKDGGKGGRNLNARTLFFYTATVNTPAMAMKLIERGSKYAYITQDKDGEYFDGDNNYKLNLPKDPPAKRFMSVVVYDPQTRSELQTGQTYPSKNNTRDDLIYNKDGSLDLYFGPKAPRGKEKNWIQTVPGKGWFAILRLYSPTEPWYNGIWRPGEIELVK
jgi:hypothetical protein